MRAQKERVTITVDRALIQAGSAAVAAGRAASLSGWINLALAEHVAREERLVALADAIALYETSMAPSRKRSFRHRRGRIEQRR